MKVKIDTPHVWIDRTLQTASWWDEFVILPGTYDVQHTAISGHPCDDPAKTYYTTVTVDVVWTREYRVNRLLSEHRAALTIKNEVTTHTFRCYAYEVGEPGSASRFGCGGWIADDDGHVPTHKPEEAPA